MSIKILFVDDDPFLLQAIQRSLMFACPDWTAEYAESGDSALEVLAQDDFDVVVSDMKMPGISGAELLETIRKRHPETIRFVLSGQSELEQSLRAMGPAHQYLQKPCQVKELRKAIERVTSLNEYLQSSRIRQVVGSIKTIPVLPDNLARLSEMLNSPTTSAKEVGGQLSSDIGLTTRILQMANSPLFGPGRFISDVSEAVSFLGFDIVNSIVFSSGLFSAFKNSCELPGFVENLSSHCLNVGLRACCLAKSVKASPEIQNHALISGMIHDVGKLLLADQHPAIYANVDGRDIDGRQESFLHVELKELGATHADIAAHLFAMWGLPSPVVEAVAFHHNPDAIDSVEFSPLMAVYLANELEHHIALGDSDFERLQGFCDSNGLDLSLESMFQPMDSAEN